MRLKKYIVEITNSNDGEISAYELHEKILDAFPDCYINVYEKD